MESNEQFGNFFKGQPTPEQGELLGKLSEQCLGLVDIILELPESKFRTRAIMKLEECQLWADKAILLTMEHAHA